MKYFLAIFTIVTSAVLASCATQPVFIEPIISDISDSKVEVDYSLARANSATIEDVKRVARSGCSQFKDKAKPTMLSKRCTSKTPPNFLLGTDYGSLCQTETYLFACSDVQ